MTVTTLKTGIIGAVVAASVAVPWVVQRGAQVKLREKNAALRLQTDRLRWNMCSLQAATQLGKKWRDDVQTRMARIFANPLQWKRVIL